MNFLAILAIAVAGGVIAFVAGRKNARKGKETLRDTSNKSSCFLTDAEIQEKLAYLDSLNGKEPDREVLIAGIAHKYICYEVWSRETGHMWNTYSPLHRTPTEKEMDFADLETTEDVRLDSLLTRFIRDLFVRWRDKNLYKN